jgi:hypothetical protein
MFSIVKNRLCVCVCLQRKVYSVELFKNENVHLQVTLSSISVVAFVKGEAAVYDQSLNLM